MRRRRCAELAGGRGRRGRALPRQLSQVQSPREAENIKSTPPAAGVDKTTSTGPAWCAPLKESPRTYGFGGHLSSYYAAPGYKGYELFGAADALCHNDPKEPIIQQAATEIVQLWMNSTGLSQADAVESIKMWLDKDHESLQKQICNALAIDDEVGGAERAFQLARRELFECGSGSNNQISLTGPAPMQRLVAWLDSSAKEPDEIARLSYVFGESNAIAKAHDDYRTKSLVNYAVDQIDYKAFQPKAALALLDSAPYKDNAYARVVVKEAIGKTRLNVLAIEGEVQKLAAKDPDWKSILIDAPQKGAADWMAAAAKYKAELQRSADFEQKMYGPSKKAFADCEAPLKKDVAAVLKTLKRDTAKQLVEEMNAHPVAGLLFRRYHACVAGAGDPGVAAEMRRIKGIRVLRGPRAAAYYATIDAIGKVRADRAKFAIEEHDVGVSREDVLDKLAYDLQTETKHPAPGGGDYHIWEESGVVKSAAKGKDGLKVVFAVDKQQRYIETNCTTTNHIIMFDHDGQPIYYRKCKGSVQTVDVSPNPINIPLHLVEGVAVGKLLSFGVSNSQEKRISMPFEITPTRRGTSWSPGTASGSESAAKRPVAAQVAHAPRQADGAAVDRFDDAGHAQRDRVAGARAVRAAVARGGGGHAGRLAVDRRARRAELRAVIAYFLSREAGDADVAFAAIAGARRPRR